MTKQTVTAGSIEDRGKHGIFSRMGKEGLLLADNTHLKNTADAS